MEDVPARFIAYDILECDGSDVRCTPLDVRRTKLELLLKENNCGDCIVLSEIVQGVTWSDYEIERQKARQLRNEGLMLKRTSSLYGTRSNRGDWWTWKTDPYSVNAVMLYAQRGQGRRTNCVH